MSLKYDGAILPLAKYMRKHATPQENHLWYDFLSHYKVRFQRQKVIDRYIADFYCYKAKLIIEIDGVQHDTATGIEYDQARTNLLATYGLKVIRFTNQQIDHEFADVCQYIDIAVDEALQEATTAAKGVTDIHI